MEEIWKDVKNYEGYYQVSNFGNVRSVDRIVISSNGKSYPLKGKILKMEKGVNGYLFRILCKNGKTENALIHRLVAEAFIQNLNNLPEVNHKDENKANNCVENLEWCSRLYNMRYGTATQRRVKKLSKPVLQLDTNTGQVISEYPSTAEAARQLNIHQGNISNCCIGKQKTAYGYKWRYRED